MLSVNNMKIVLLNFRYLSNYWIYSWNWKFGNCFTFNPGANQTGHKMQVLRTSMPGPNYGKYKINENCRGVGSGGQGERLPPYFSKWGANICIFPPLFGTVNV